MNLRVCYAGFVVLLGCGGGGVDDNGPNASAPIDFGIVADGSQIFVPSAPVVPDAANMPAPGDKPDDSNTGPTDRSKLVASGPIKVTTDGTVIENVDVSGDIDISASDVTIRNFRVASTSYYAINILSGTNIVLEDGELTGAQSALIKGDNFTARRLNLHDCGADAMKPGSNVTVESSYIHRLGTYATSHADGVQLMSGSNSSFTGNNFDIPAHVSGFRSNSTFIIGSTDGKVSNITIANNWLDGGNYTIYLSGDTTSVAITGNQFGRDYNYGLRDIHVGSYTWTDNVWMDTKAAIAK